VRGHAIAGRDGRHAGTATSSHEISSHEIVGSCERTTSTSSHDSSSQTIAIAVGSARSDSLAAAAAAAAVARLSCCCWRRRITPVAYKRRSRACAIWSALLALSAVTQKAEAYGAETSHSLSGSMIESKPMAAVPLRAGPAVRGVRRLSLGTTAAPAQGAQKTSITLLPSRVACQHGAKVGAPGPQMLPQATMVVAALLVWGGVLCDALLVSVGGGAPSASIERTRASSATMHAAQPARRTSTISAQLQSPQPPEGFEWGYDSSAAAADAGGADAASSPEELLLKAIEALREQDLARARELLAQARAACEQAGGPTDEQASLLELVAGRVSTATLTLTPNPNPNPNPIPNPNPNPGR